MPNVAVVLSGCGFLDGAEIHEAVLTLLALDQRGAKYTCCAPNVAQSGVLDHRTHKPMEGPRNVLIESARIARGEIRDLASIKATEFDALILPGGYGAAKNLCDFASKGPKCGVHPEAERVVMEFLNARKPIGAICIAPALVARIASRNARHLTLTIGTDAATGEAIGAMGCRHEPRPVTEIAIDVENKIVSTPAYMLGPGPAAVWEGIRKLVDKVLELA